MRKIGLLGVLAVLAAAAAAFAGGAGATTFCNTIFTGSTDRVIVLPNDTCVLLDAHVSGNVFVLPGGGLAVADSDIGLNVKALQPTFVDFESGCAPIEDLLLRLCDTQLQGNTVGQNVIVIGATGPVPEDLPFFPPPSSSEICDTDIGANLKLVNNQDDFVVGGPEQSACLPNHIHRNLIAAGNTGLLAIFGNTIDGRMICLGNASVIGAGNTAAAKLGDCSGV